MARRGYVQLVFQSTLPLRGATAYRFSIDETLIISIHTPLAGSDAHHAIRLGGFTISIHTPLAGSDYRVAAVEKPTKISIHTPLAGSDSASGHVPHTHEYFNPHSPCGERLYSARRTRIAPQHFNPHSPCGERLFRSFVDEWGELFQSTLPLRGATAEMRHF